MGLGLHYWTFSAPGDPQRIADTLAAAAKPYLAALATRMRLAALESPGV